MRSYIAHLPRLISRHALCCSSHDHFPLWCYLLLCVSTPLQPHPDSYSNLTDHLDISSSVCIRSLILCFHRVGIHSVHTLLPATVASVVFLWRLASFRKGGVGMQHSCYKTPAGETDGGERGGGGKFHTVRGTERSFRNMLKVQRVGFRGVYQQKCDIIFMIVLTTNNHLKLTLVVVKSDTGFSVRGGSVLYVDSFRSS